MAGQLARRVVAEYLGTGLLVATVVGSGIMGTLLSDDLAVVLLVNALATVAALGVLIWMLGPISGAHVNPAVTLAMLIGRRMPAKEAVGYWIVQFIAAIAAAAVLKLFVSSFGVTDYTGGLGTNSYDNGAINMTGAFVLEALLTAAFVLVIVSVFVA